LALPVSHEESIDMSFDTLGLHESLTRAVKDAGYTDATEVQLRAIPLAMQGKDLMVSSSTGSGKTASFVLPALMRVLAARAQRTTGAQGADPAARRDRPMAPTGPRVLVLTPTRELAMQVAKATIDWPGTWRP
jgi:superfamily II DNA/RNA helicase